MVSEHVCKSKNQRDFIGSLSLFICGRSTAIFKEKSFSKIIQNYNG